MDNGNGSGVGRAFLSLAREALAERRRQMEHTDRVVTRDGVISGHARNAYLVGANEERQKKIYLWCAVAGLAGFAAGCLYMDQKRR